MSEEELRAMVREAVERHLRGGKKGDSPHFLETGTVPVFAHASHLILPVQAGEAIGDGICLIEPTVRCSHCGYCQSYGH